jgi:hypothetical protein
MQNFVVVQNLNYLVCAESVYNENRILIRGYQVVMIYFILTI